jgi:Flp pilus assembly protein TadG
MMRLGGNPKTVGTALRPASLKRSLARIRSSRGAVQIEFALTIIVVIFVMFWMWELIMLTYTMNVLADAAKEGVRTAIVQGSIAGTCPTTTVTNRVKTFAAMSLHNMSAMTVKVYSPGTPGTCKVPNRVRVEVTYPFIPFINLPANYTLHAVAEGRIVFNAS